jgi:hypothetical protein
MAMCLRNNLQKSKFKIYNDICLCKNFVGAADGLQRPKRILCRNKDGLRRGKSRGIPPRAS